VTWNHLMKRFDMIGSHGTLSTDFINEPRDKSRDSHAHFIHVRVVGSTLRVQTITLSNTTDTHVNIHPTCIHTVITQKHRQTDHSNSHLPEESGNLDIHSIFFPNLSRMYPLMTDWNFSSSYMHTETDTPMNHKWYTVANGIHTGTECSCARLLYISQVGLLCWCAMLSAPPPPYNRFTAVFPGQTGWAGARRELLDFVVQGKINRGRHTDHPAGRHSIRTKQCPPPLSLQFFYRPDALPAAQATVSKHWRQCHQQYIIYIYTYTYIYIHVYIYDTAYTIGTECGKHVRNLMSIGSIY